MPLYDFFRMQFKISHLFSVNLWKKDNYGRI